MTFRRLVFCAVLTALALAPAASQEAVRRPMTAEDLWAMERVGSPALSPDGRWVAFTVTGYDLEKNKGNGDLWLVPADGSAPPRRLTWNDGPDSSPVFSPDGGRLAFVSKRGEDPAQLYVLPLDGGEARRITDLPVGVSDPKWMPDGKRIVVVASTWPDLDDDWEAVKKRLEERKEDKVQAKITENRMVRYWDHYITDGKASHFFMVDLASGEAKDLLPGWSRIMAFRDVAWDLAPDGTEIVFSCNASEPPYRTLNWDLFLLPTSGKAAPRNITPDNPADDGSPRYTRDGRFILYGRNRRVEVHPDFTRLARLDPVTGETTGLTDDWDGQPSSWTTTPDGKTVVFHGQERGRVHLWAMPVDGGRPSAVVRGGATGGVEAGPDGLLVYTLQSLTAPPEIHVAGLGGGASRPLTDFNGGRLAGLDLGTVEDVTFAGADGDPVQMFVLHPPGFDTGASWPLLHLVHGGPHGAHLDGFHSRWNAALFAAPGYVTALVNFHGSTGSGQAFAESILGAHGDKPFTDIMKATDLLLARGYIDADRMAAAGGSYGGYLVSWILGHTDRFGAIINHAGVYDLMAQFASDYTYGRNNNYGATPWADPQRIDLWSPSRYAAGFNTPTLVIHGEKDYRVPYTQGLNLYGVLKAKGVPARLVVYPDENHWISKPQSSILWWSEVHGWLDRWIGKGPGEVSPDS